MLYGLTVRVALVVPPFATALIVTVFVAVTAVVLIVNVPLACPAGIVMLLCVGFATARLLLDNITTVL